MSRSAGPWHCPTCLRSVPPRVETCYCGTSREQAERAARAAEPEDASGGLPWVPMGLVLLALGVLVVSLRREAPPPAPEPVQAPAAQATVRPPPPPPPGSPPRVGVSGAGRAAQTPAPTPPPPTPPPPTPEPEPEAPAEEEEDELETRREEARAAFEARLGRLAARRDALQERLRAWETSCGSSSSAVRPAGCVLLQEDVEGLIAEIDAGLSESEQEARRNWVQPGDRRSILEGHELDPRTWGALRSRATSALR